jgi:hypothetical protein
VNLSPRQLYQLPSEQFAGRRIRLFVRLGDLQELAIPAIVAESTGSVDICLNVSDRPLDDCPEQLMVVRAGADGVLSAAAASWWLYRALRRIARLGEVEAYLPHAFHSTTNYIAFYLSPVRLYLLPDGILNYYSWPVNEASRRRMYVKKLAALCLGGNYQPYRGCLTGGEVLSFDGHFMYASRGLTTDYGDYHQLAAPPIDECDRTTGVLFLDHPVDYLAQALQDRLALHLRRELSAYSAIYYKRHRDQLAPSIADFDDLNCILVDTSKPAEVLVGERGFDTVVSMCSSGLLMTKVMYPGVHCVSVGMDYLIEHDPELAQLKKLMEHLGITMK